MGFPVARVTAHHWAKWVAALKEDGKELGGDLLIDNHAPECGQVFRNQALAQTLKVKKKKTNTKKKKPLENWMSSYEHCYELMFLRQKGNRTMFNPRETAVFTAHPL